jgi:aryl-alcohol dehydrogenase-like predicted oxidoreductase
MTHSVNRSPMQAISLPGADFTVSELCFGANPFGDKVRGADADRLLGQFIDAGGNFFDTAHCYSFWVEGAGAGSSERELGAAIRRRGCREQVVVATKGGHPAGPGYPRPDRYMDPARVAEDIRESLANLGFDTIDLYYLHRDDPRVPVAEIIEFLNGEIAAGRIRAIGASNWPVPRIQEANAHAARHGLKGFSASQVQWSLPTPMWEITDDPTTRHVTEEDAELYEKMDQPIVAYSATASGYLTGRDNRLYDTEENRARRERARELAAELGVTANQIGLAYLRSQEPTVIPLFGTTNVEHLMEAVGATKTALTPEQAAYLIRG